MRRKAGLQDDFRGGGGTTPGTRHDQGHGIEALRRTEDDKPEQRLEPRPYHVELRVYLKSTERELWNWFASAQAKADYTENLRLELLKSTYRLDAQPALPTPNRDSSSTCP